MTRHQSHHEYINREREEREVSRFAELIVILLAGAGAFTVAIVALWLAEGGMG